MGARHYMNRSESARIDALVLSAFDAGGPLSREEIHDRVGRARLTTNDITVCLHRLKRAGKVTHSRKDGWSKS